MSGSIYENGYIRNLPKYALPTAALTALGGYIDSQKDDMGEKQFFVRAGRPEDGTLVIHGIVPGMPESSSKPVIPFSLNICPRVIILFPAPIVIIISESFFSNSKHSICIFNITPL